MFGECELCGELDELERLYAPIGKDLCKECVYSDEVQDKLREDRHR